MAKREKEVVEGEGRGGRSRTSSSGNLPFPRLFRPFKYLMDSGFYILHPRFYTELGCAMTLLDFIYVCMYMCIYSWACRRAFTGVRFSTIVLSSKWHPARFTESDGKFCLCPSFVIQNFFFGDESF